MGADVWEFESPGHEDPDRALEAVQVRVVRRMTGDSHLDLKAMAGDALSAMRESLDAGIGELFGFREQQERALHELESLSAAPMPVDTAGQIDVLRKIFGAMGLGRASSTVLDARGTTPEWCSDASLCHILGETEVSQYLGTDRPTLADSQKASDDLREQLQRGRSVCWRYYDESGSFAGWYFMGGAWT